MGRIRVGRYVRPLFFSVSVFFCFCFFFSMLSRKLTGVRRILYLQNYTNNDFVSVINGNPLGRIFSYTSHYYNRDTRFPY